MGKRTTGRRLAMQALYEADFGLAKVLEIIERLSKEENMIEESLSFAKHLACGAFDKKDEIDSIIKKHSKDWPIERMSGVDRNILRVALYELIFTKTPPQVVINEALELAKKYSSFEAAKFINGILGGYIKAC
ncbi:transcription antitermination factor NusB [candidate division WOR-1 bacterium RIFOXYA2_FULL_36_21]|uniref:Transcription antitermination protein NusB n=1 Tax=candidate division WOR-1 bacterium RIFOXYB2_FULL_36_35 TaxID=1802578 RepID=A0A1F4S3V1_UNCSA|nr:MAG: transcription antitermination factor NusB [candidate division WOR-1 bacterium RIFOXYA2_FULL_36_21]OGC15047.1 MAG: transcription antitermination factor NusB [candidate division WOR-1 bacterium RIFOXYB2_FULL_36_35]OGC18829.1 MAG: transcription antitermination factor NusB [candidate division WOR-1 bacterium RIFOXYA12_FULL_36_13]